MDERTLYALAVSIEPALDWVVSHDGDGQNGSGMLYAAACVGTTMGAGTVNLGETGGFWIAELLIEAGNIANGDQRSAAVQVTVSGTAQEAYTALLESCTAVGSLLLGIEVMQDASEGDPNSDLN